MLKKLRYPLGLAVITLVAMRIAASFTHVAADGMVVEPGFFMVPLGELSLLLCVVWSLVIVWRRHHRRA